MLAAYRPLFASRKVLEVWLSSLLGRLQLGTLPLALIFCVQGRGGSVALAGSAVAAVTLTTAISATPKGRLIDKLGMRPLNLGMALLHLLCLLSIALLPFSAAMVIGACLVAGLTRPNLTTYMRVLWRAIHREDNLRERASALEAAASPMITISGPILVGALYALIGGPETLIVTGALTALGTALFALSVLQPTPRKQRKLPSFPWGSLSLIMPVVFFNQVGIGVLQVAVPEWAKAEGSLAASGALMACFGAGAMAGGLIYGSRSWRASAQYRLLLLSGSSFVLSLPLALVGEWAQMAVLILLLGAPVTAMVASIQFVMQSLAPPERDTEVLSWWVTIGAIGVACGNFAAGYLADHYGASAALLLPAGTALLTASASLLARRIKTG